MTMRRRAGPAAVVALLCACGGGGSSGPVTTPSAPAQPGAPGAAAQDDPTTPATSAKVPGAPTGVAAVGGVRSAVVTWTAPPSDGGRPVTGYVVEVSPPAPAAVIEVSGTSARVTKLASGTAYAFRVHATNAVGDGPNSDPSPPVTPASGPPVLTALAVTPARTTLVRGTRAPLTAVATYDLGAPQDVTAEAQWTTSDAGVAAVDAAGAVIGVAPGVAAVGAAFGGLSQQARVTVIPAVTALAVVPGSASVPLGRDLQVAAVATLEDGSTAIVTAAATWVSSAAGALGVLRGKLAPAGGARAGDAATITASFGGASGSTLATVVASAPPIGPGADGDPLLPLQWHLHNTGQTALAWHAGIAGNDIGATATYAAGYSGRGVKVAVVDSGLELAHEDLAANVVAGSWNFSRATKDPTPTSKDGDHGTSVAGLIAAARGNGKGGMGVAPEAGLNGYNVISVGNQSLANFVASLGGGTGAAGPGSHDAWIFNQSFGSDSTEPFAVPPLVVEQYRDGVTSLRGGLGAVYLKAAGNGFASFGDGGSVAPDCARANAAGVTCHNAAMDPWNTLPENVVVGALNARGKRSSYSSAGSAIWVSAPGGEYGISDQWVCDGGSCPSQYYDPAMVTTDRSSCDAGYARLGATGSEFDVGQLGNPACNYTNTFNGTSAATPVAAGVVALVLEANPSLTWRDVKNVLASTARQVDPAAAAVTTALPDGRYTVEPGWVTNAAGYRFHDWYGFGAVDADSAVEMARAYDPDQLGAPREAGPAAGSVAAGGAIPDASVEGATGEVTWAAASGLVVESVQVEVQLDHPALGDLGIELSSPSGTRSVVLNAFNGFGASDGVATLSLASNAFFGEASAGTWRLKVVDAVAGNAGRLVGWTLRIGGH
jgi:subtilisin family serine protease